jgi:hypothetical protein
MALNLVAATKGSAFNTEGLTGTWDHSPTQKIDVAVECCSVLANCWWYHMSYSLLSTARPNDWPIS